MKRLIVLLVFAVFGVVATNAQTGYQSFLNGDTIQWNIDNFSESGISHYAFCATDTFYIDSVPCKKLNCLRVYNRNGNYFYQEYPSNTRQYLCEDTITGRLWMYFCNNTDTTHFTKKLLVDMSLNVGETFSLPLYNYRGYYRDDTLVYIVDSVKNINGKKHIFMSYIDNRHDIYPANIFIEGVGSAQFLFFPIASHCLNFSYSGQEERFLLCNFKDGNIEYYNYYYFYEENPNVSDCFPPVSEITQVGSTYIKITAYPNPAKDRITFDFGGAQFETLQVINTAGVVVREVRLGGQTQYSMPINGLPSGVYVYRLQNEETATQGKIVVE
jgi:hypothetical protein